MFVVAAVGTTSSLHLFHCFLLVTVRQIEGLLCCAFLYDRSQMQKSLPTGTLLLSGSLSIQRSHMQPGSTSLSRDVSWLPMKLQWKVLVFTVIFEVNC